MRVRDFMVTELTTLNEDACLLDAALTIRRTGRRHLPVVTPPARRWASSPTATWPAWPPPSSPT